MIAPGPIHGIAPYKIFSSEPARTIMQPANTMRAIVWRRLIGIGAALAGLLSTALAGPASVPIHSAPPAWVQYANLVDQQLEARLGGDSEEAKRLRGYLQTGDRTTIAISVWVDANGVVTKIGFAPFLDSQANADLTTLLQGVKLPSTPPAGILLPVHLKLHVGNDALATPPAGTPGSSRN